MPKKRKAVAWLLRRVSSEGQEDGMGLEAQLAAVQVHAKRAGFKKGQIVTVDPETWSGYDEDDVLVNRPAMSRVLREAHPGDAFFWDKSDRPARSPYVKEQLIRAMLSGGFRWFSDGLEWDLPLQPITLT